MGEPERPIRRVGTQLRAVGAGGIGERKKKKKSVSWQDGRKGGEETRAEERNRKCAGRMRSRRRRLDCLISPRRPSDRRPPPPTTHGTDIYEDRFQPRREAVGTGRSRGKPRVWISKLCCLISFPPPLGERADVVCEPENFSHVVMERSRRSAPPPPGGGKS